MPVEKKEPHGAAGNESGQGQSGVFPRLCCLRRFSSPSNAMTGHPRSPVRAARDSRLSPRVGNAKFVWQGAAYSGRCSEALARRYKGNVSGDPRQVMWGPEDSERTESMASGRGADVARTRTGVQTFEAQLPGFDCEAQHDRKALATV